MAGASYTDNWPTTADDVVTVFRALEPIVAASAKPIPTMKKGDYNLDGGNTNIREQDLEEGLDQLPGPATAAFLAYHTDISATESYPGEYWISLHVLGPSTGSRPTAYFKVEGPAGHETRGLFEHTRDRVAREIQRQEALNWGAPSDVRLKAPVSPPTVEPTESVEAPVPTATTSESPATSTGTRVVGARSYKHQWPTTADDAVTVFRNVEPIVGAAAMSFATMTRGDYELTTGLASGTTEIRDQNLEDAVDQLSGPPTSTRVHFYTNMFGEETYPGSYYISLRVSSFSTGSQPTVYFTVDAPGGNDSRGLFEETRDRITREIDQQEASNWGRQQPSAPQPAVASAAAASAGGQGFWQSIAGQIIAGVIYSLIAAGIVAIIAGLHWHWHLL